MTLEHIIYILPQILALIIVIPLIKNTYERRDNPMAKYFLYFLIAATICIFAYTLELASNSPLHYLLWKRVKYTGVALLPIFWVPFALLYSDKIEHMSKEKLALLIIIPIFSLSMLYTNTYHNLFFVEEELHTAVGPFEIARSVRGPIFWIFGGWFALSFLGGLLAILREAIRNRKVYLKQSLILTAAVLIALIGNIVSILEINPGPPDYDISFIAMAISGLGIWYGIFQLGFMNIFPIARNVVFENISDTIFVLDSENKIVDYNQPLKRTTENHSNNTDKLVKKKIEKIFPETEQLIKNHQKNDEIQKELKIEQKDNEKWYNAKISPIFDKQNRFIGRVLILRNITERKEAEEREEFLHSLLRHDLGNKLIVTKGWLELLNESDLSEEDQKRLESSLNGVLEGLELIENTRTLHNLESGEKEKEPIDLKKAMQESLERHEDLAEKLNFEINNNIDKEIKVEGGLLLKELFSNLVENSLNHSEGSRMNISLKEEKEKIIVTIEDNGKGIPDDIKEKITQKGFKGEDSSGTGLGMHLAKRITETYGEKLKIMDSELGGARFDIILNRAEE